MSYGGFITTECYDPACSTSPSEIKSAVCQPNFSLLHLTHLCFPASYTSLRILTVREDLYVSPYRH